MERERASIERISNKEIDIFSRQVLLENPDLERSLVETMRNLAERGVPLPFVHITTSAIRATDGSEHSTGFIESILSNGLKAGHTNVSAFISRENKPSIATPDFFLTNPEEFIKSIRLITHRYGYHGSRINKDILGEHSEGEGVPVLCLIEGDVPVRHGSDYDDHYILSDGAAPNTVIGTIDLDGHLQSRVTSNVAYVARSVISLIDEHYLKS